jgi:hypothetical protein
MRIISKALSIILLGSIFLNSCGAVTPIPAATPTVTATITPTKTYTPTPVPTSLPTITPTSTPTSSLPAFKSSKGPEKNISFYKLRPWHEFDYGYILKNVDDINNNDEFDISYYKISDYLAAFQLERLLMFPDSHEYDDDLWNIQSVKPNIRVVPGLKQGEDLLGVLISNLLDQGVPITDLEIEMRKHGHYLVELIIVPNLNGNGEDGFILSVRTNDFVPMIGFYAILRENGAYQVENIVPWEETNGPGWGHYYELHDVGDTNENGLPEVVLDRNTGVSGDPGGGSETISHIEWSQSMKGFSVSRYPVFSQGCDEGPCGGDWEFASIDSQSALITRSYWSTRGDDCPDLILQQIAIWDDKEYAYTLGSPKVVPPKDDLSQICRLAWADVALSLHELTRNVHNVEFGWKNDLAISIVEQNLADWLPRANHFWGLAGRDYFKLRLGIWHDLRGKDEQAVLVLNELAGNPHLEKFDFMSHMAELYLQTRTSQGKVKACSLIEDAYDTEYKKIAAESSIYDRDRLLRDNWGVVGWAGKLCNPDEMLPSDAVNFKIVSSKMLMDWLRKSGVHIYQEVGLDLNNDGNQDYLFLLDASGSDDPDVWAFFASPEGYQARHIYDFYFYETDPRKMKVLPFQVGNGEPIYLITANGQLIVVRLTSNNLSPEVLVDEYFGVQNFRLIDNESLTKVVVNINDDWDGKKTNTYQWDSSTREFVLQDDLFVVGQTTVENMIYNDHDYIKAISYIDHFLATAPPEPLPFSYCAAGLPGNGCVYEPDWYVPYFRYLQGLAYEKLDQKQQAAETYFNLWKMFPNNVFGVAASLKLEPASP